VNKINTKLLDYASSFGQVEEKNQTSPLKISTQLVDKYKKLEKSRAQSNNGMINFKCPKDVERQLAEYKKRRD